MAVVTNDLISFLQPSLIINRFSGLLPFSIKYDEFSSSKRSLEITLFWKFFSILVYFLIALNDIYALSNYYFVSSDVFHVSIHSSL